MMIILAVLDEQYRLKVQTNAASVPSLLLDVNVPTANQARTIHAWARQPYGKMTGKS
jgi:hypothetical protein